LSNVSDFQELTSKIRDFAVARDWEKFHTPKNLAMAIAGEAGELAAEFQWLTAEGSTRDQLSEGKLRDIRLEIADVQIYLVRLGDVLGIDIPEAVLEKMKINEGRF
jgi:NTP pyrophosphatase (non-canonical NTP hydrolase)